MNDNMSDNMSENKKDINLFFKILISLGIFAGGFAFSFGTILFMIINWSNVTLYEANDLSNYDIENIVSNFHGDINSKLSIFPDANLLTSEDKYQAKLNSGFFDMDGYIVLEAKYDDEIMTSEIERLKKLEMTIRTYDGESYTNKVMFDNESYDKDAYITIDGFCDIYEYALLDYDNNIITYVYLAYPKTNDDTYKEYLKKDLSIYYADDSLTKFSMYNHTFDGGQSFIEFDDLHYDDEE